MQIIRKWVQKIAADVVAEKRKEWAAEPMPAEAMDGRTEDGLLLCYAWSEKLIGAEDALRRVRLWQKEHDPDAVPRTDTGSMFFEWRGLTDWMYQHSLADTTLRNHIRQIALEADAQIKAASHKAAQKALKAAAK